MFIDTENNFICSVGDLGRITINRNFLTDIYDNDVEMISEFKLHQNYPNPFNPTTTISYSLPKISNVSLIIYDMMGREVKVFEKNGLSAGVHSFVWDGTNNNGELVSSGIYISKFRAISEDGSSEVFEKSGKLMLLK